MITWVRGGSVAGAAGGPADDLWLDGPVVGRRSRAPDRVVDADGLVLLPGWIDTQVNGAFGIDLTSTPDRVWGLASRLVDTGVTAFLPTLVSPDAATVALAVEVLAAVPDDWRGARPLGWHLEGPFIAPDQRGTHPASQLRGIDLDEVDRWAASGRVRLVTLAPEVDGAVEAVRRLVAGGVVVAAGHSAADHEAARSGFDAGITGVTHLFNAMPGLHHREPGLLTAALADPRIRLGAIGDGLHLAPETLALLDRLVPDRIHLVTDAMAAAGLDQGTYRLGDLEVVLGDDGPRNPDGGLAGSAATYDEVVRTWQRATGAASSELAPVTSSTAAGLLGEGGRGHLRPGAVADVTGVDATGTVALVVAGGQVLVGAERIDGPRTSAEQGAP